MTSTHTPGPWHYETGDDGAVVYTGFTIAKIPIDGSDWQSNAYLIASAPDLLAALERLAHPMADDDDLDYAREVIAKAKGGQQ
jgi:hypothetical protein